MLEPFIWMFKTENFKEHVKYLIKSYFIFYIIAIIAFIAGFIMFTQNPDIMTSLPTLVLIILGFISLIAPVLLIQGYFWDLTEQIINREWDISASCIYDGKVKNVFRVTLPDLSIKRFIWRGIASGFATFLMVLPFISLTVSGTLLATFSSLPPQSILFLVIFMLSFIPALLWNYAKTNSVVAVWNIRKAIYIMGNYTGKYVLNVFLYIVFYIAETLFLKFIYLGFGADTMFNIATLNPLVIVKIILFLLVSGLQYIYCFYVYAYLLGTIAPTHEA